MLSVFLVGANAQIKYGASLAAIPVVLLLPVWVVVLRRSWRLKVILSVTLFAIVWGFVLGQLNKPDHITNSHQALAMALLIASGIAASGVLLWACDLIGLHLVCQLYAVGLLASQLGGSGWQSNPWKHALALPLTIAALALAQRLRKTWLTVAMLALVAALSAVSNYRSFVGFCLLTVILIAWQSISRSPRKQTNRLAPVVLIGAIAFALYQLVSTLLVGGYLGSQVQARTLSQTQTSGSILLGGRPEWTSTIDLMAHRPSGYGLGVVPNAIDINIGDHALINININPDYGYEQYMFIGQFRLHSIVADLWTSCGWAGLLLAAVILIVLLQTLSVALAERRATALQILITSIALWDLAFSPIFTNLRDITLALALGLQATWSTRASTRPSRWSPAVVASR